MCRRMYLCICLVSVVPATRMESTMTDYCELSAQQQLIITIGNSTVGVIKICSPVFRELLSLGCINLENLCAHL